MKKLLFVFLLMPLFLQTESFADGGCSDGNERGDKECPLDRSKSSKDKIRTAGKKSKVKWTPPDAACPLKQGYVVDEKGDCVCPEGSEEVSNEHGSSCVGLAG